MNYNCFYSFAMCRYFAHLKTAKRKITKMMKNHQ